MSKWTWINELDRPGVEAHLLRVATEETKLRLQLLDLQEEYRQLEYRHNRLRREAGEIK